jgi:hypothetical protein
MHFFGKKPQSFSNLYDEQLNKRNMLITASKSISSKVSFSPELIIEWFKLEILCVFAVLYPNIIPINMNKTELSKDFIDFQRLMNTNDTRKLILNYVDKLSGQEISHAGGMKRTRKVKRTKSKSKRTTHRK